MCVCADRQWLTFWLILTILLFVERYLARVVLSTFPMYYEAKLAVMFWLLFRDGADDVYRLVRRLVSKTIGGRFLRNHQRAADMEELTILKTDCREVGLSPCSLHLPASPCISLHLRLQGSGPSPCFSLHLPASPIAGRRPQRDSKRSHFAMLRGTPALAPALAPCYTGAGTGTWHRHLAPPPLHHLTDLVCSSLARL